MNEEQQQFQEGYEVGEKGRRFRKRTAHQLPTHFIVGVVCGYFKTDVDEISQRSKRRAVLYPRQILMYFLKKYSNESLSFIGRMLGGLDHGTVAYSIETIQGFMDVKQTVVADDAETLDKIFANRIAARVVAMEKHREAAAV